MNWRNDARNWRRREYEIRYPISDIRRKTEPRNPNPEASNDQVAFSSFEFRISFSLRYSHLRISSFACHGTAHRLHHWLFAKAHDAQGRLPERFSHRRRG